MRWIWKPIDSIADWLLHSLSNQVQLRIGVLVTFLSLPLLGWMSVTKEARLIFFMSAAALTLSGISWIISAQALVQQEEHED